MDERKIHEAPGRRAENSQVRPTVLEESEDHLPMALTTPEDICDEEDPIANKESVRYTSVAKQLPC